MTVHLVSSNPTKKRFVVVRQEVNRNPLLSDFLCFHSDHLDQLRKAGAVLFKVEEKVAILAAYKNKDPMHIFIPNLCVDVPRRMTPGIALAAEALRRGISTAKCGLYVEQFPRWQDAPFLAQIGLQMLLFNKGDINKVDIDHNSVDVFEKNGVKVIHVGI